MAAAEGAAKLTDSQQCELRVARDRVQKKLDTATSENARLSRAAAEKDRVLADARTRVEYLEAALAAAEAECGRLTADAAKACDKHQAETSRAITAEKLLAAARERLLARIIEIDAVRQRVAQANAVTNAATTGSASSKMRFACSRLSSRSSNARSRSSRRQPKSCCNGSVIASARLSSPRKRSKRSWSETRGSRLREIVPAVQTSAAAKRHSQVSRMPRTRRFRIGPSWRASLATLWNARQRPRRRRGGRAPPPDPVGPESTSAFLVVGAVVLDFAAARHAFLEIGLLSEAVSFRAPCARIADDARRAVSAEHFLATSAVAADAPCGVDARVKQIKPANTSTSLGLASTIGLQHGCRANNNDGAPASPRRPGECAKRELEE